MRTLFFLCSLFTWANSQLFAQTVPLTHRGEIDTFRTPTQKTVFIWDATFNPVSVTTTSVPGSQPDVFNTSLSSGSQYANTGSFFPVAGTFQLSSLGSITSCKLGYYLSTDASYSSNDVYLRDSNFTSMLISGSMNYSALQVTIPTSTAAGNYYLISKADYNNAITESNENNNEAAIPITVQNCNSFSFTITGATQPASGLSNGSVTIQASNNCGAYNYTAFSSPNSSPFSSTNASNSNTPISGGGASNLPNSSAISFTVGGATFSGLAAGTYIFIVTDTCGCAQSLTYNLTGAPSLLPLAAFSTSQSTSSAAFTNNSVQATSYAWDFGDTGTSSATNPNHTYANTGSYTVKLKASNANGSDSTTQQVSFVQPGCNKQLQIVSNRSANLISTANPLVFSVDNPSQFTSFSWSGGGSNSSLSVTIPGSYFVITTDANSCTYQSNILLAEIPCNNPPTTSMLLNGSAITNTSAWVCTGSINRLSLTNSAQYYQWYKDSVALPGGIDSVLLVSTPGYYHCILSNGNAATGNWCSTTTFNGITLAHYPSLGVTVTDSQVTGAYQSLVYCTSIYSGSPAPAYLWSFGDGGSSAVANPIHAYTLPGLYNICLTVTDACDSASACIKDTIRINYPVPAIPNGVSANAVSTSQIQVGWSHSGQDVQEFVLYRSPSTAFTVADSFALPAVTPYSFIDTGLQACTIYYYRIKAKNFSKYSGLSSAAFDTTLAFTPAVSIAASKTSMCGSQPDTFTANSNVPNAQYQWKVNGIAQASTGSTLTYNPANNDTVNCTLLVPPGACFSPQSAASNAVIISVITPLVPNGHVTVSDTTCLSSSFNVTYSTTNAPQGAAMQLWESVNSGAFTAGSSQAYNGSSLIFSLTNGSTATLKKYYFRITPPSSVCSVTGLSDTGTTVSGAPPVITAAITTYTDTVCMSIQELVKTTITGAGPNPAFQWYRNGVSIVSSGADTLFYVPTASDTLTVKVTSARACSAPVTSSPVVIYAQPLVAPYDSIFASSNPVCADTSLVAFTTRTNIVGGTIQWYRNGVLADTSRRYVLAANQLSNGDKLSCLSIISPNVGCYTKASVVSDTLSMTVNQMPFFPGFTYTRDSIRLSAYNSLWSYQWLIDGVVFSGATSGVCPIVFTGVYSVRITTDSGCSSTYFVNTFSPPSATGIGNIHLELRDSITVSPNPTNGSLEARFNCETKGLTMSIHDIGGKVLYSKQFGENLKSFKTEALQVVAPGAYYVVFRKAGSISSHKIIKQ